MVDPTHSIVAIPIVAATLMTTAILASSLADRSQPLHTKPPIPQDQVEASSRTPLGMAVNWARMIHAAQRQPDSVLWEQVLSNRDGSVICLAYRVRSGDSDIRERVAFVSQGSGFVKATWDSACTGNTAAVDDAAKWISSP
jgi:hypothetical protein